jgi:hypothetical protein
MEKTILALSTLALSLGAFSASNTTITSKKKSSLPTFIQNTSVSAYVGIDRENGLGNNTEISQNLNAFTKWNDNLSTFLSVRTTANNAEVNGVAQDSNDRKLEIINPRLSFFALNTEVAGIDVKPQLRIEAAINDASDTRYATARLGVTLSKATSSANTVSAFAGTYEGILKEKATRVDAESSNLYLWISDSYSFNDKNSASITLEDFKGLNQDTLTLTNKASNYDLTISYANTMIKSLSLSPYLSHNMKNVIASDQINFGLDATYSF